MQPDFTEQLQRYFLAGLYYYAPVITEKHLKCQVFMLSFLEDKKIARMRSHIIRGWVRREAERLQKLCSIRGILPSEIVRDEYEVIKKNHKETHINDCLRAFCCINFRDILETIRED